MSISALIPAYNEENTISEIITTLKSVSNIEEVLVVDDGSADSTSDVAMKAGARVIRMSENRGKAAAIQRGVENIKTDLVLMLDGDLIGLNESHINKLIIPLMEDQADMVVGLFNEGRGITDLAQFFAPNLSGQRALKVSIFQEIENLEKEGFGIEILLNKHVKKNGRLMFVNLPELTHVMKEEKMGFVKGLKARFVMYGEILKTVFVRFIKKNKNR